MPREIKAPVRGRDKVLYFRLLRDAGTRAGGRLALQVEHEWTFERDNEVVSTKDGGIVQEGALETSLELTAISTRDELNKMLHEAVINSLKIEVWEVDLADRRDDGKFGAKYAQGNLNEWSVPANVDELEELTTSMSIDGSPVEGTVALSEADVEEVKAVYSFADLVATPGA